MLRYTACLNNPAYSTYTCIQHLHLHTALTPAYSTYTCIQHLHLHTALAPAYSTYTCIQHLHLHTALTPAYSTYTCIQHLHLHTALIPAYSTYTCIQHLHLHTALTPAYSTYTCIQHLHLHTALTHAYSTYTCIQHLHLHTAIVVGVCTVALVVSIADRVQEESFRKTNQTNKEPSGAWSRTHGCRHRTGMSPPLSSLPLSFSFPLPHSGELAEELQCDHEGYQTRWSDKRLPASLQRVSPSWEGY